MPTVLLIAGWRLYFYSNEGKEPVHIHAEKANMECKFWLNCDSFEIKEAYSYQLTPAARREVRRIIYNHFDYIVGQWEAYFGKHKK